MDDKLRVFAELVQRNPLMGFDPFARVDGTGGQIAYLQASLDMKASVKGVRVKMGIAGNQAGKSIAGVVDDLIQCLPEEALPERLRMFKCWQPPFRCRVVTMDLGASLYDVIVPLWQKFTPKEYLVGGSWDTGFDKTLRVLRFQNGSQVQFMSSEQPREKHQGATLDRVRFDEEPPPPNGYGIYRESRMRVLRRNGEIAFNMTPSLLGGGLTWTYDEVYNRRHEPHVYVGQWSMLDNPYLDRQSIEHEISMCSTEAEKRARIYGDFVSFRGRVLEELQDHHVIDPIKRSAVVDMDVLVGYDPGLTRGGVVWAAFDQDNSMLVFDELYPQNLSVEAIVAQARVKNKLWGLTGDREPLWVIDPSMRIRDMATARESVHTELLRLGVSCIAGQNDRLAGILAMKGRLEHDRLHITRNCTNWLREADRWLIAADEDTLTDKVRSTAKGHTFATIGPDHLQDPTRYICLARAWPTTRAPEPEYAPGYRRDFAPAGNYLTPQPEYGPQGFMG